MTACSIVIAKFGSAARTNTVVARGARHVWISANRAQIFHRKVPFQRLFLTFVLKVIQIRSEIMVGRIRDEIGSNDLATTNNPEFLSNYIIPH